MRPSILIIFATVGGTAQSVANALAREAQRRLYAARMIDFKQLNEENVLDELNSSHYVFFIVSTTGQGDLPPSMRRAWRLLLRRSLAANTFSSMEFGVFGLGDSSYSLYNMAAKKLFARMSQLGARPLAPRGDGDDQHEHGLDGALEPWLEQIWQTLDGRHPLPFDVGIRPSDQCPPARYRVSTKPVLFNQLPKEPVMPTTTTVTDTAATTSSINRVRESTIKAKVVSNERVTREQWKQEVRHIDFQLPNDVTYTVGDVAHVWPVNPTTACSFLSKILGYEDGNGILVTAVELADAGDQCTPAFTFPLPCTLSHLFAHYFDILGTPNRYFFDLLAHFATSERERERLRYFASKEGIDELLEYNTREHRSYIDNFQQFPSARPPSLDYVFDLIAPLRPRAFSIASGGSGRYAHRLSLLVAVVCHQTPSQRTHKGLCTTLLSRTQPEVDVVELEIERNALQHEPPPDSAPLILVGPGTGAALACAFINRRLDTATVVVADSSSSSLSPISDKTAFFFGCRRRDMDDYCSRLFANRSNLLYCVCYSQESPRRYVQQALSEHSSTLSDWILNHNAYILVSGRAKKMPDDVKAAFVSIVRQRLASDDEAQLYIKRMIQKGRYLMETWDY